MFMHPGFDPVIFNIYGPLSIRWYGLAYAAGFFVVWYFGCKNLVNFKEISKTDFADIIFYTILGVVLGGRIGYALFYGFAYLKHDFWRVFRIWEGGMSFHGAFIGALLAIVYAAYNKRVSFWRITDLICVYVPVGLFFGRAANFINGELWGRVTDVPWAVVFPLVDSNPRHPSQIYEMLGEGLMLFIILQLASRRAKNPGYLSGLFLLFYGSIRFILEYFRAPDQQLGFVMADKFTMGQVLSLPMIMCGLLLLWWSWRKSLAASS